MVGVWVGNNDNSSMLNVASGVSGASPIWRRIVTGYLKGKGSVTFEQPSGVDSGQVDTVSGYQAHDGFPSRNEYFIKGNGPSSDPVHVNLKICKNEGKLATPSDIAAGNYDNKEFFVFKEEDPLAGPGQANRWQEGILNWEITQSDSRYHPPSDYCGTANPVNVDFTSPHDQDSNIPSGTLSVSFNAGSSSAITQADLLVDGSQKCTFSSLPFKCDIAVSNGVHVLKAEATDAANHKSERVITIGVGGPWNPSPSPSSTP